MRFMAWLVQAETAAAVAIRAKAEADHALEMQLTYQEHHDVIFTHSIASSHSKTLNKAVQTTFDMFSIPVAEWWHRNQQEH
jgi:hypothetical protein